MTEKSPSVVFVSAHPDDIELFGAGLMLLLKSRGWDIHFIVATDGARANGERDPQLAALRADEAAKSAIHCGAELTMLGFPDKGLSWESEFGPQVSSRLMEIQPSLCITHHPEDYHPDHRAVSLITSASIGTDPPLLYAEPIFGFGPMPKLIFDITSTFEKKVEALTRHESQQPLKMCAALEHWNRFRGLQTMNEAVLYGEGFFPANDTLARPDVMKIIPADIISRRFP